MKRRQFINNTVASTAFITAGGLSLTSCSTERKKHITILHTNDVHSHIDPFPATDARNPNQGGVARRATLIEQIRTENPNTLLLDAGDIFQGTPYFNFYGGEIEFKLMSMLKYDAATLGNHDFDNGIDGLLSQLPNAKFEIINGNYDFSNTIMDGQIKPYKIFTKDGLKIGVFGLGVELEGLVTKGLYKETKYLDPIEIAQDLTRELKKEQKCDLVICLSHLGFKYQDNTVSDIVLAQNTENIDLIIGGHTHTFLDKPVVEINRKGQKVLINQVGCYGIYLGRIDFYFDEKEKSSDGISINV
ncbi:bifunctional metallophosphatase/5'-nucleotidase [Galbibacter orientalis]|uniref:5'-nucleotidase/2',3'-cyclic phosphodiesterase-like hydrolase n=1 Tax=Galbibacter orientalis DSM 19592 TaxID=926559 RepID=I3C941_9FLAO|nr:metallophosphatase [Galbibacter orientalis]EIJ40134.1 5'-nucleotidase/2',3'-cyclic phosphodiesterase-like hydrolase [Galbibacter orientalis DSM 19592]